MEHKHLYPCRAFLAQWKEIVAFLFLLLFKVQYHIGFKNQIQIFFMVALKHD